MNVEPEHLDPRFPGDALGSTLSRLVYGGLLDSDPVSFSPLPGLAEDVRLVDPLTVRAVLRPGLAFHDGSQLTSRDVAATFQAVLDPRLRSTMRGTFARVFRAAWAVDPRTVHFRLTGPDGTYPSLLQQPIVRASDALLPEIVPDPGAERRFIGAGPMRVRSLSRSDWTFERVAPQPGRARTLRFVSMHDPNTLALRMLHGDADVAELKPELFSLFERRPGYTIGRAPSAGFTYLGLRNDHPVLARLEVRRAIAHAIDRHGLVRGKLGAYAAESTGPLAPTHWAYEGNVARYPYDLTRARRLIGAAGRASRNPLVMRCSSVRFAYQAARAIVEMLRAIGIDVELRQSDLAGLLADLRAGRYDLAVMTMPDLSDPWGMEWLFASSSRPTAENPRAGGNRWRYSSPRLDALLTQGRQAHGTAARRPFYARAQAVLADELPVIPLWHADLVFAGGPRVTGLQPRGDAQLDFLLRARLRG